MAIPRLLDPNTQPMDETNGMPSWLNPMPVTSPNEGFGAWASDSRNMAKIAPSLTPQPSAPGVDPQIPQTLFSNGEDLGMPKRVDLGLPSINPPSLSQDMQNAPEAYGKPYLKNGQPSKWDRVAAALMGFSGGLRGNPSVGADYIHSLEQHDLNLPEQNQRTYNQRFIQPQLDALAVPAAKARVANMNAQTEHMNAETQAMVNPAAPLDKHLGGYENDDGKQVEIFQNASTGKPYEVVMGNVNQKEANAQIQAENAWLARPENKGKDKADAAAWYATLTPQAKQQFHVTTGGGDTARLDKSYQFNSSQLEKMAQPYEQTAQRMSRLVDTINQKTPQADALVAPELLTVMAGGQGSGLRMNEAEISRIVGGRNAWQSLKSTLMRYQADPNKPFLLTESQRGQVMSLINAVQKKSGARVQALQNARQNLVDATSVEEHRQIVSDARKKMDEIENSTGESPSGERPVYDKDGKLLGYTVDGKTFSRGAE